MSKNTRHIERMESVTITDPTSEESIEISQKRMVSMLLSQKHFATGYKAIKCACEIEEAFDSDVGEGGCYVITERSWEMLKQAAESPTGLTGSKEDAGYGMRAWAVRGMVGHLRAIIEAEEK